MPSDPLPLDLETALAERPDGRRLAQTWATLGLAADDALPPGAPSTDDALAELERRLDRLPDGHGRRPASRPRAADRALRRPRLGRAVAAAVLLVGLLAAGAWWAGRPIRVTTSTGQTVEHALPDGSVLWLNAASTLTYPRGFRIWPFRAAPERRVALDGEAFFEVAAAERPFVVETFNAEVRVVGTAFSVRARVGDRAARTYVAVHEGRVAVRATEADEAVVLAAGASVVVGREGAATPDAVPAERVAAWRGDGFALHDLPLGDVLAEVERRFGVTIRVGAGLPLDRPLTLYYGRRVTAEDVLRDVALATGLRYRPLRGGFELVEPASP